MDTYTKEQVDQLIKEERQKWEQEILNPIKSELEKLKQSKPTEPTKEDEKDREISKLRAQLLHQKLVNELSKAQLEDFADFINVKDEKELNEKVEKLKKIVNERKINNSYRPSDHKPTDAYSQAEKAGDVEGMVYVKLQKFFN